MTFTSTFNTFNDPPTPVDKAHAPVRSNPGSATACKYDPLPSPPLAQNLEVGGHLVFLRRLLDLTYDLLLDAQLTPELFPLVKG